MWKSNILEEMEKALNRFASQDNFLELEVMPSN